MPFDRKKRLADYSDAEEPVELLKSRPSRARRNRDWEKRQRNGKYTAITIRRFPRELNEELNRIAKWHRVTVSEVARRFIEYGLEAYERGELGLEPQIVQSEHFLKYSLFPEE